MIDHTSEVRAQAGRQSLPVVQQTESPKSQAGGGMTDTRTGPPRLLWSASQLAEALGCGGRTVWAWHASGRLPMGLKISHSRRWRAAEIRDWIRSGCPPRTRWQWPGEGRR